MSITTIVQEIIKLTKIGDWNIIFRNAKATYSQTVPTHLGYISFWLSLMDNWLDLIHLLGRKNLYPQRRKAVRISRNIFHYRYNTLFDSNQIKTSS
ncbi:MAG: hypothetical protein QXU40_03995 [Candidatus Pacearchaeota archaeon]